MRFTSALVLAGGLAACTTDRADVYGTDWSGAATMNAYPSVALHDQVAGLVVLQCRVEDGLRVDHCVAIHENPPGHGFAEAAIRLKDGVIVRSQPVTVGDTVYFSVPFCFDDRSCERVRGEASALRARFNETGELPTP